MMNKINIIKHIGRSWEKATPGFLVNILHQGREISGESFGVTYPIYDWASLTKIIFTQTLFMKCVQENLIHENDLIGKFLPELKNDKNLKIRNLLSHTASLPSTINFWKHRCVDPEENAIKWRSEVLNLPMAPTEKSFYTEIDFQILGYVLEKVLGSNINQHWINLSKEMGLKKTFFRPIGQDQLNAAKIAPTEICPLRNKKIQGEVHHPDIWQNGGIGWLAGLFGPMEDLIIWANGLRSSYYDEESWVINHEILMRFVLRERGNSSLGFMMPHVGKRMGQKYYVSCGEHFSLNSIGHTGFTGPMFWFDPERDLIVLTLANRTFPLAENENWFHFRGILHDAVVLSLEEQ